MKNITNKQRVRFLTTNVNGEFTTNLTEKKGDKIGLILTFEDNTQYLVAFNSLPSTAFGGTIITHISHFERYNDTLKWNSIDEHLIDKTIFPNINSFIIDAYLFVNLSNGTIVDSRNTSEMYEEIEVKDADGNSYEPKRYEQVLKANYVSYFEYIRYGQFGIAMENRCFEDLENKISKFEI